MEFVLCGWPEDGPTLRLDYRAFSYAGKFATSGTGKAVLHSPTPIEWEPVETLPAGLDGTAFTDDVVAAVSFDADRAAPNVLRLRYVSVHVAHRGEGNGPALVRRLLPEAAARGYDRARIAVNNPFAYEALYKAGFAFTGQETGIAELVLERPIDGGDASSVEGPEPDGGAYRAGLDRYRARDLSDAEEAFLDRREDGEPPDVVTPAID